MKVLSIIGAKKGSGQPRKPNIAPDSAQSKTRIKIMYGLSEGEILGLVDGAKSIFLEDTPLQAENGSMNFENVHWQFRHGTNDQEYISGFEAISSEVAVGVELKQNRAWVKSFTTLEIDAVIVRLRFGALRTTNAENGDVTGATVEYAIDIMTDGTAWVQYGKYKVSDKTSANYERSHRVDLPRAEQGWQIRVRRLTADTNNDYLSDKSYIQAYTEVIDAKLAYPNTALLSLEYDAETFSNVAKMSVECFGVKIKVPSNYDAVSRQYHGLWDGTFKLEYTNNPAWHFYDACINKRYALGDKIDSSMIDKWSIYRLGQYCDEMVSDGKGGVEPRFTLNVYEQSQDDAWSVLSKMAGAFRAYIYWDGQAIVCDADMPQETYFTYTHANVIDGHFERSGTAGYARHTVAKVAWNNPQNHYKTEYVMVRDEQAIAKSGIKIIDIQAYGCTSEAQAQRAGLWALKSEQLETQTITFKVGLDGYIPQPGKVIEVADPIFAGRANGGRVAHVQGTQITLDRDDVICQAGDRLIINSNQGKAQTRIIQSIDGRVITVVAPFDDISAEHIWVIDAQDLATMKYRVVSITQDENHQFTITGLEYNPKKYDAIDYGTVIDTRPTTLINSMIQPAVERVDINTTHMVQQGLNIATMVISFPQVKGATKYLVEWKKDDGNWIKLPMTGTNSVEVQGIYDGHYQARVTAISAFDMASLATYSAVTQLKGKTGKPPKLAKLAVTGTLFGMKLDWVFASKSDDTAYTEIQVSPDSRANIATLGQFAYPTDTHQIQGLQGNLTQFYRARIVDKLGNESDWTDWTSGTTSADPQAILDVLEGQISESLLDQVLAGKLDTMQGDITANAVQISAETTARTQAIANEARIRANAITAEANNRTTAITNAIRAETTNRTTAINNEVTNLTRAITTETTARTQAINTAILSEVSNRTTAITNAIRAETANRTTAINNEVANLTRAITTETTARTHAIQSEITARTTALSNESKARTAEITTKANELRTSLTTQITSLQDGLTQEIQQRKDGDNSTISALNAYKLSNDNTVATVLQKAESSIGLNNAQSQQITALQNSLNTTNTNLNTKADSSALTTLDSKVTTLNNTVTSQGNSITQLNNNLTATNANVAKKADTTALNSLTTTVTNQGNNITAQGNKLTQLENSLNTTNTNLNTKADSSALTALDSKVTTLNNTVTSQGNSITQLNNNLTAINANVAKKADTTALNSLTTTVTNQGNNITAQGNKLTQLENSLNTTNTNLNTKADSSALTALDSKVTTLNNTVTSQGNSITQLNNNLKATNNNLSQKADSSALTALNNNITALNGTLISQANQIIQLTANITQALQAITVTDTRNDNQPPNWYWTNHKRRIVNEFKFANVLGLNNFGGFVNLETRVYYPDPSGGAIIQTAYHATDPKKYVQRNSIGSGATATWSEWKQPFAQLSDEFTAKITEERNARTTADSAQATQITQLTSSINTVDSKVSWQTLSTVQDLNNMKTQGRFFITATSNTNAPVANWIYVEVDVANSARIKQTVWADNSPKNVYMRIFANPTWTAWEKISNTNDLSALSSTITNTYATKTELNTTKSSLTNILNSKVNSIDLSNAVHSINTNITNLNNTQISQANQLTNLITRLDSNNLCLNPSMKDDNTGWSSTAIRTLINNEYVIELTNRDAYYTSPYVTTANQGDKFFFRAKLKVKDSTHRMRVGLSGLYSSNNGAFWLLSFVTTPTEANDWIDVNGYLTVPADLKNVKLWCGNEKAANTVGNWYIKDVVFQRLDNAVNGLIDTKANSSALTALDSKVTTLNNTVTSQGNSITQLNNNLTATNANVAKKADTTVLNALSATVTQQGSNITSQSQQITNLQNSLNATNTTIASKANTSAVTTLQSQVNTINGTVNAHTNQLTTLNTTVGSHTTSINQQMQSINGISAVRAVTVDNNGVISGYGLMSELRNGRVTSQFGVNADTFYIGSPSNNKKPFIFNSSPRIIDGVQYPAGAWINSAYIANATIKMAHIDKASIGSLSALSANLGTLTTTDSRGTMTYTGSKIELRDSQGRLVMELGLI